MKLASYHGTRAGLSGIGNRLIRLRLRGVISHTEVVFEPGDGPVVAALMPDGKLEPDANGALWCASATATERLPDWSRRRAGKMGGVRFKRIAPTPDRWYLRETFADPLQAALWACRNEGVPYDWQLIVGYLAWVVPHGLGKVHCSEASASMLGIPDPWRFDPCALDAAVRGLGAG